MTDYDTADEKRTDPRPAYIHLGRDGDGAVHTYRTTDETVHVAAGGDRTHREALDGRSVHDWMDFVAARRGWTSKRMYRHGGSAITAGVGPTEEAI